MINCQREVLIASAKKVNIKVRSIHAQFVDNHFDKVEL